MPGKFNSILPVFAAIVLACTGSSSQAAGNGPPAGQMCAEGAYVIGFDAEGNIVCSGAGATVAAKAPATLDSKDRDACPESCAKEAVNSNAASGSRPTTATPADAGATAGSPVISDIKPPWVVFGARETTIRIIGAGFTADTIVKFQGGSYSPSVNPAGTELRVTIATRDLPMGRYAITVSNGEGMETTQGRALEVF